LGPRGPDGRSRLAGFGDRGAAGRPRQSVDGGGASPAGVSGGESIGVESGVESGGCKSSAANGAGESSPGFGPWPGRERIICLNFCHFAFFAS
jgi:hypothetical protein